MTKTKTIKPDTCKIVVVDDILDTVVDITSPQSVKAAMKNHGAITEATHWLDDNFTNNPKLQRFLEPSPIGVAIRKTDSRIVVHWHVTGDPDAAREARQAILAGGEEGGGL